MSVGRNVIADVWGVEEDHVRCETCAYYQAIFPFCAFYVLGTIPGEFCSFWTKGGDASESKAMPKL